MNKPLKITARNDYAFKKLFARYENKDIFIEFVSIVTGINKEDFEDIIMQNKEMNKNYYDEKHGIVDVKAKLKDGTNINIEMQNRYYDSYPRRSLYYWSKIYAEDLKESYEYSGLNKTISINLLNEKFTKTDKIHSIYRLYEETEHTLLDDALEIHYLDMSKLVYTQEIKEEEIRKLSELEKWLIFIQTDKKEVRKMLSIQNETMQKANRVMERFYSDNEEREMYNASERYEMDKYFYAQEQYMKGIDYGMERGIMQGIEKGVLQEKREIAISLIKEGVPYSIIVKTTGLDENTLKGLR